MQIPLGASPAITSYMREFWEYLAWYGLEMDTTVIVVNSLVSRVLADITADVVQTIIEESKE